MKKFILALSVGCFSMAYSQNLSFANSNFKALILSSSTSNNIAKNISGNPIAVDTNGDGEIQLLEAQQVKILTVKVNGTATYSNMPDTITDALLFSNVEELYISDAKSAVIQFSNNSKIKKVLYTGSGLYTDNTGTTQYVLPDFSFTNCSEIQDISQFLPALNPNFSTATILRFNNCPQITGNVVINEKAIKELYIENCSNITSINTHSSYTLEKLHIQNMSSLTKIIVDGNSGPINSQAYNMNVDLTATNCPNLEEVTADTDHYYSAGGFFSSAQLSGCPNLKKIKGLNAPSIDFSTTGLVNLEELDCSFYNRNIYSTTAGVFFGNLTSLNLSGLPKLKILKAFNQPITNNVNFSAATALQEIDITGSCGYMNTVNVSNLPNLHTLKTDRFDSLGAQGNNDLQKITAKNCIALTNFVFRNNSELKELDLQNCPGLQKLSIGFSAPASDGIFPELNKINLQQCTGMKEITIQFTKINALNTTDCVALTSLDLYGNDFLPSINVSNNTNLEYIGLQAMPLISQVNTAANTKLTSAYFNNCPQITQLNFSTSPDFRYMTLWNMANLTSVNARNGSIEDGFDFMNYNSSFSVCVDDAQLSNLQVMYPDINFTTTCGGVLAAAGKNSINKNKMTIAPNPVKDFIMVKSEENIKNVKVFDAQGRIIFSQDFDHEAARINLSGHPAGNYIVKVKTATAEISKKIVKEN
ncbi:T9SS type A sorting domain-containing protein [Chryseobacterium sp. L7]|uniref:T9SS type A sorting domain-containing protein n=1 Tax=Chryseobacterium endalhagicum TaxID=2797638 RepID=A0ABS1QB77_9FLAO|nr:T9SS type A sorting domain-containing protein [Chryseobacterium endalhagicum]MBL1219796.1 T9SS type A sorting domain-containing protein [Chryseobacterium endalhagicum]